MWEYILGALFGGILVEWLFTGNKPPLHGVYAQPGRWYHVKRLFAYVILSIRQRRKRKAAPRSHPTGYGPDACAVDRLEQPRQLAENPKAGDSVYFNGMDHKDTTLVLRVDRRPEHKCDVWMTLQIPDVGCLLLPGQPNPRVYHCDGTTFSAAGLKFECLEAMRRWKVTFNGMLRRGLSEDWTEEESGLIHVRFSFIWDAFTDVFDFDFDPDPCLLSDSVAREPWSMQFYQTLQSCSEDTHYEQWGELAGSLLVEGTEERKLELRGLRCREHGVQDWQSYHRCVTHIGHLQDGTAFHVSVTSQKNKLSYLQMGYVSLSSGVFYPLTWTDLDLPALGEFGHVPEKYSFNFSAGGRAYQISVDTQTPVSYHYDDGCIVTAMEEKLCVFEVNGIKGSGVARFIDSEDLTDRHECGPAIPAPEIIPFLSEARRGDLPEGDQMALTLPFTSPACTSSELVGGKGCQLAMLTQCGNKDFIVPKGFCLTIEAFKRQLQENLPVKTQIKSLHRIASGRLEGKLQEACEDIVRKVKDLSICPEVRSALEPQLTTMFGDLEGRRFAVRSSAAGEDGEDMSAAGQMDTILGAKGMEQIFSAVTQCWASHFAFTAVEYRRQHGQLVTSSMGVVIQEMVPSQVSGVLFTQDPLTGHPGRMTINANYGLGESVVSGSAEPDSITVAKCWEVFGETFGEISISNKTLGRKKTKIEMTTEGGTQETEMTDNVGEKCCLDDDLILRLAKIAVHLEKAFTNPRDIEWAVNEGQIFLLQARPITTLAMETDWDIEHEYDTPLASDEEILTTANISEMMPGAVTPLTASTFIRGCEYSILESMQYSGILPRTYNLVKFLGLRNYHPFINMSFVYGMSDVRILGGDRKMTDLALLGEVLSDVSKEKILAYWGSASWFQKLRTGLFNHYHNYDSHYRTKRWGEWAKSFSFGEHRTAESLYSAIHDKLPEYMECWSDTVTNSGVSAVWSSVLMATLTQGKPEWTVDHYSDVAMLLSKCEGVYSADVPSALQKISVLIRQSNRCDEFIKMSKEDAVAWLTSPDSDAINMKFQDFLKNHGHRCIREAEFREKSWQTDPTQVVSVIQSMLKAPSTGTVQPGVEDVDEAIAKIKSPLTYMGKKVLKFAVPRARRAVGGREWGKSISIEVVEIFKQAYWKLAKLMREEGYLPDEDLLFFLTHQEIGQMLRQRPARLVAKAQKRRRLHPKLMGLQYPRINTGHPQPIEEEESVEEVSTSVKLTGTPVSQGRTRGFARVVKSLADAGNIQLGDILVVSYTDVGWSPYFPLISGLVTEIGGLLSHGAVVAREYGLPCIVNVKRATSLIKSGDEVIIDGTKGVLQKVSE